MKLVPNARRAWTWFSVQAMAIAAAIQGAWAAIPDEMRESIPPEYVTAATISVLILGAIGRLVDQSP